MKKIKRGLQQNKNEINQLEFEADKKRVAGTGATFTVKYLGSIEVREARGVNVCMNATTQLYKAAGKNKKKTSIVISMDGVRVVDNLSRVLIIDQPIEKISFCSPDPGNKYMFSYIARDGASRRWLCHAFIAVDELGERLSHALGCAFTACLQRKQKSQRNSNSSKESPKPSPTVPKEMKVPDKMETPTQMLRDRSATAIGISTPPTPCPLATLSGSPNLEFVKTDVDNPFGDSFDPGEKFSADPADILLFDVNSEPSLLEVENRDRSSSHQPQSGNVFDEFDPLNKKLSFEDNFIPPIMAAFQNLDINPDSCYAQHNGDNNFATNGTGFSQNGFTKEHNGPYTVPVISIDDKTPTSDYYNAFYQSNTLSNTNPFNDNKPDEVEDDFAQFASSRNAS